MYRFSMTTDRRPRTIATLAVIALGAATIFAAACGDRAEPTREPVSVGTPDAPVVRTTTPAEVSAKAPVIPENITYADAEAAFRSRDYVTATLAFEQYVTTHPENPFGFYMLGLSAWKSGEHERATGAFEEAIRLDPRHVKSHFNLARVLLETGKADEAREQIVLGLEIDSTSAEGYRLLGRADYEAGNSDGAIDDYRKALTLDDRDVWSMNNLGLIYIRRDQPGEAILPLARAVELRSNAPVFQNNLGMALELVGQYQAASQTYEAALAADSTYVKASENLQRVQHLTQDAEEASVDLKDVALKFQDMIQEWKTPVEPDVPADTMGAVPEPVEVDSVQ
jgi:predicted Zn-dependent protease